MKIKTSELTGAAFNWAVCKCEGEQLSRYTKYSTDWAQGGPIIEREGIALHLWSSEEWIGDMGDWEARGSTPLIAAMRCYVASKLGDEVEVPDELVEGETT
jgi:hypothetical protein